MMHHGGNTLGFSSDLAFLPEAGVGISVVSNGRVTNAFNEAVRFRLLELLFAQPMEFDAQADFIQQSIRESMVDVVGETLPVDEAAVAPFLGAYSNPELGDLVLEWEAGALYADVGEFRMEVRVQAADEEGNGEGNGETGAGSQPGEPVYLIFDAPFTGLPLQFEQGEDDQPQVRFGEGVDEYLFTPAE